MGSKNREELYVTVPRLLRCPISMDVMKSPVSLCTGITYDRSSIQKWLSQGHNTCPATMQVLSTTDFTPNLTLRRLIHLLPSVSDISPTSASSPLLFNISQQQALGILKDLGGDRCSSLGKIIDFLRFSQENREFIAESEDAVSDIVKVLDDCNEIEVCKAVVTVLDLVSSGKGAEETLNRLILRSDRDSLSRFVSILRTGCLDSRIKSARILEFIAIDSESQRVIAAKQDLLHELYRLISDETERFAVETGLSALLRISTSRAAKKELLRLGIVTTVRKILAGAEVSEQVVEKAMKVLEVIATCTEGRSAIGEDEECVVVIVKRLMKCSRLATEHGITVVWCLCCVARDERARARVMEVNGLTKVLLVMQSDCSNSVRQMCGDLVKVLRIKNSKSCLATYDTKTTHIMPY